MTEARYPRDLHGYGRTPPDPRWPGGAKIAVQFVVNFEEGGENNILHGDSASEAFLSDVLGAKPWPGKRHPNIESMFEYGSRSGFWRLLRIFKERKLPATDRVFQWGCQNRHQTVAMSGRMRAAS